MSAGCSSPARPVLAIAIGLTMFAALPFALGHAEDGASPTFGIILPARYRDWKLVSVAHEEGDIAIQAYREGKLPFPDGTIIARLAWSYLPSEENNKVFGRTQSFVVGPPTNVQFMVKDAKKYAPTGGWGFAQFDDGKPANIVVNDCFSCHVPVKDRDFIFTRYAP
jgi:hypothetical protein